VSKVGNLIKAIFVVVQEWSLEKLLPRKNIAILKTYLFFSFVLGNQ